MDGKVHPPHYVFSIFKTIQLLPSWFLFQLISLFKNPSVSKFLYLLTKLSSAAIIGMNIDYYNQDMECRIMEQLSCLLLFILKEVVYLKAVDINYNTYICISTPNSNNNVMFKFDWSLDANIQSVWLDVGLFYNNAIL